MQDLSWFRELLDRSRKTEPHDPSSLVRWLEYQRAQSGFSAELIGLREVRRWGPDKQGNIVHESGQFFSIEGVRIQFSAGREVASWDQPIFNQKDGGILAIVCRQVGEQIEFLLFAKSEPGNIGALQLAPSIQATWSNLNRAHGGSLPPLADLLLDDAPVRVVYKAFHNEEGGRFWRKSNSNQLVLLNGDGNDLDLDENRFIWASLSQIKGLMLFDNIVNPFVKTILAPL